MSAVDRAQPILEGLQQTAGTPVSTQPFALSCEALRELGKWNVRILPSIPFKARHECMETLRWVIRQNNGLQRFSLLLAFGKAILRGSVSAGIVSSRCMMMKTNPALFFDALLAECRAAENSGAQREEVREFAEGGFEPFDDAESENNGIFNVEGLAEVSQLDVEKVEKFFRLGCFAKASAVLATEPLAPFSKEIADALRSLHPASDWRLPVARCGAEPAPSAANVSRALSSFSKGTAAGPFGLRPDHLREMVNTPGSHLLQSLATIGGQIINGEVPTSLRPLMFAARLVAIYKKNEAGAKTGAVRPVACGEAIRRLACKIVAAPATKALRDILLQFGQAGFGVPNGVAAAAMAAQRLVEQALDGDALDSQMFLKTDLSNAFNRIRRESFLQSKLTAQTYPSLATLADSIYGQPSDLFFGAEIIVSSEGVHQGCPLGGILFAITLVEFLKLHVSAITDLTARIWIADDGFLAGSEMALSAVIRVFVEHGPTFGLYLNCDKCTVFSTDGTLPAGSPLSGLGVKVKAMGLASLLGCAIGSRAAREAHTSRIANSICSYNERLAALAVFAPQSALCILRSCSSFARASYFIRHYGDMPAWKVIDTSSAGVLNAICPGISSEALTQAFLPCRMGGLGIRSCATHAVAAHSAAMIAIDGLLAAFTTLPIQLGIAHTGEGKNPKTTQRAMSQATDEACLQELLASLQVASTGESHGRAVARIAASAQKGASLWLAPNPEGVELLMLSASSFRAGLRHRLGLHLFSPNGIPPLCVMCRKVTVDVFGDHPLLCLGAGNKTSLHHECRDVLARLANMALLRAKIESRTYDIPIDATPELAVAIRAMRCDISLLLDGAWQTIDVTTTHALRSPFGPNVPLAVERVDAEKRKAQADVGLGRAGLDLVVAFDSFGGCSAGSQATLKKIASAFASRHDCPKEAVHRFWAHIHGRIVEWTTDNLAQVSSLQ
jgi:hypothetical protein